MQNLGPKVYASKTDQAVDRAPKVGYNRGMKQKTADALLDLTKADYNSDGLMLNSEAALNVLWENGLYEQAGLDALHAWLNKRGYTMEESEYSICQTIK